MGADVVARRGFSKADLLVVLAMVGILVAVAVPNVLALRMQAARAEVPANVDAIRAGELAYRDARGAFLDADRHPRERPDSSPVSWPRTNWAFEELGFAPDAQVRGVYQVTDATTESFTVAGIIDADGDGRSAVYTATRAVGATLRQGDDRRY